SRARNGIAELAVRILRILFHHAGARQALLIAQLDAAEIEHAVLHRREHFLAPTRRVALVKRGNDAERQVQAGAGIADLCAGDHGRAVVESRGRSRSTGALRDVLVHLAILVGSRAESLDRSDDHARIELLDALPGEAHAVERTGGEILDQYVAMLHQRFDHLLSLR